MLPAYDNYLVGYRTREVSVPASHRDAVWPGGGVIRPTVIADGLAIGTWTRGCGARRIQVDAFGSVAPQVELGVGMEKASVVRFLRPTAEPMRPVPAAAHPEGGVATVVIVVIVVSVSGRETQARISPGARPGASVVFTSPLSSFTLHSPQLPTVHE